MHDFRWWLGCAAAAAALAGTAACGNPDPGEGRDARQAAPTTSAVAQIQPAGGQPGARVAAQSGIGVLPSAGEAGGVVVNVAGMGFHAEVVRIKAGQTITWTFNDGEVPHTATAFDGWFDTGVLRDGSVTLRFDRPGEYCYQCVLHPGRNLCSSAAVPESGVGGTLTGAPNAGGGGGHMQGKIIVE
jgi:plastocyanin